MEDSGIDSEDKLSSLVDVFERIEVQPEVNTTSSEMNNDDLEVSFRDFGSGDFVEKKITRTIHEEIPTSMHNNMKPIIADDENVYQPPNTCRILQRKLELKVQRAKRNYNQYQEECAKKSQSSNLIPINRLSIPGYSENQPLVDYKSDNSEEPEEVSFFPIKLKSSKMRQQELSDTFSIQEMTIESDNNSNDSGDSQNLELLPPRQKRTFLEAIFTFCGCYRNSTMK